ncbi:hypothetical protein SteCoe_36710 [Stentor coeruleus]|uniref:Uncharacterized protein n=1 Tax=Stentor coeruleus TaxID=5963 RepID=A0A1R2APJ5_9CILI|nr:hypothetical protein SteCoe_36710 [Stentor coeruleus]
MSLVIKVLDRRLKKFYNTQNKAFSQSMLKKIKLDPIQATPIKTTIKKSNSIKELNPLHYSADIITFKSKNLIKTKKTRHIIKAIIKQNTIPKRNLTNIADKLKERHIDKTLVSAIISWKHKLRQGIINICNKRKKLINAVICIQKNWKMHKQRKKFLLLKNKVIKIQRYWKYTWTQVKRYKKIKFLACKLNGYAKLMYKIKINASIIIQKHYRKHMIRKVYKKEIEKNYRKTMHEKLLKRQSEMVKNRNMKKIAVKIIER